MLEVEIAFSVNDFLHPGNILAAEAEIQILLPPLESALQSSPALTSHFQLHAYQCMLKVRYHCLSLLDAVEHHYCLPPTRFHCQRNDLTVWCQCRNQHIFCKRQTALPFDDHSTHLLVVLLRSHFVANLLTQSFMFLFLSLFFFEKFLAAFGLCLQIFFCLHVVFFATFKIFNKGSTLGVHGLDALPLFFNSTNVVRIKATIGFFLQKLVGSVDFNEYLGGFLIFVAIRMVLQRQ